MSIEKVFPNAEQFDTMNTLLAAIASNVGKGGIALDSFADAQKLVRMGLGKKLFTIGEQLVAERFTSATVTKSGSGVASVTVDGIKFVAKMGQVQAGSHEIIYDGASWREPKGGIITLADYGLAITGTPAANDKLIVNIVARELAFDIVDFDKYTPKNTELKNTLNLLLHDIMIYGTMPFLASQLMYYTDVEMPAGNYKFTLNKARYGGGSEYDGVYMFTLNSPIPATGGFRHTNSIGGWKESYAQSDVIGNYITTYGVSPARDTVESGITITLYDDVTSCTNLGTFTARDRLLHTDDGKHNFTERQAYGSNRWKHSVYRQWLNSAAPAVASGDNVTISHWWTPQTVFERVPGGAKTAGFLYGLDADFVSSLGEVEVITAMPPSDRVGSDTVDITYDKVFLASRKDIFGTDEYSGISEGSQFEYFKGMSDNDRKKYEGSTVRYWWLRTPNSTIARTVRIVSTSGALDFSGAHGSIGVVPACCIL